MTAPCVGIPTDILSRSRHAPTRSVVFSFSGKGGRTTEHTPARRGVASSFELRGVARYTTRRVGLSDRTCADRLGPSTVHCGIGLPAVRSHFARGFYGSGLRSRCFPTVFYGSPAFFKASQRFYPQFLMAYPRYGLPAFFYGLPAVHPRGHIGREKLF